MGWTGIPGLGISAFLARHRKPYRTNGGNRARTIAEHRQQEDDYYVQYLLREIYREDDPNTRIGVFVEVVLYDYDPKHDAWMSKEMSEAEHPFYYKAPKAWLDFSPIAPGMDNDSSKEWRTKVKQHGTECRP
jgi:hypothetical protein